ncbi:hypothetical protein HBB16_05300 [Pseudonocardia sp. MCCB 268]|nr:hypothetical protein [Pseudonocardia cytotoxica]
MVAQLTPERGHRGARPAADWAAAYTARTSCSLPARRRRHPRRRGRLRPAPPGR